MKKSTPQQAPLMTIDELAALMLAKFDEQNKKMDGRFSEQDKKFDAKLEKFAMMVARGFEEQHKNLEEFKEEAAKKFEAVDANLIAIRQELGTIGDRFVSYHVFDQWAHRVIALEHTRAKRK